MLRRILIATAGTVLLTAAVHAQEAVQVGNAQMEFPESLTSLSDGTLYFGSLTGGNILKSAPGETTTTEFVAKQADGPQAVLGVFADEANGTLWACYADFAWFQGQQGLPTVLRGFDTASGAVKATYTATGPSLCNDIATTPDGMPYIADTVAGAVLRASGDSGLEVWKADPALAGADGLSFDANGALFVNSVTQNKLFRIDANDDGTAGALTEIATSTPLAGPDGMRFGADGKLYVAENQAGHATALTIDGDSATGATVGDTYDGPTAVTLVGNTLWVLEAKIGKMGGTENPGAFTAHPVALQ
jgi:sugar lactone lactonase YvrE